MVEATASQRESIYEQNHTKKEPFVGKNSRQMCRNFSSLPPSNLPGVFMFI